jgi:hypothetical protein
MTPSLGVQVVGSARAAGKGDTDLRNGRGEVALLVGDELAGVTVAPLLPNPPWVRCDHTGSGVWPAIDFLDN